MNAVIEDSALSCPLSPEQHAMLRYWGGEAHLRDAIHVLKLEIDAVVAPDRVRAAVEQALQQHAIFRTSLFAGQDGLRMRASAEVPPIAWSFVQSADDLAEFVRQPMPVEQGHLVRAALLRRHGARPLLTLAVSALVADGCSLAILAERIAVACSEACQAAEEDVFQYAQFVEWRSELEADDATAERDYWQQYLSGSDTWVAPRLGHRRDGLRNAMSARRRVTAAIDAPLLARVAQTATQLDAAPEALLQSVWWLLLAQLNGFNPYAGGWQHDCRRDYDLMRGAVGVFEKVLPVFVTGDGNEPFSAWLMRAVACAGRHIEMQEYCPIATPAVAHLAVGFKYREEYGEAPLLAASSWRVIELPAPMPCFELALCVTAAAVGAELAVHADADLYSQQAAECLVAQYRVLLRAVLASPRSPVSELSCLDEAQWQALQTDWRGQAVDVGPHTIAQRIAQWAQTTPDAIAVIAADQQLSYAELDSRANQLAHWMRAQGVTAGALVALEMPRSTELIVALLATWRCGAGYLPLEPEWPAARRLAIVADAKPAQVLCVARDADSVAANTAVMSEIDLSAFSAEPPAHEPCANDLAYVLYTSGSTGQPKGVAIEQGQLLNYVAAASVAMDLGACRRWALASSVVADLGNTALFGALFNGASLAIASATETRDADAFARFMRDHCIDALKIVPSHLEALLECETPQLPRTLVLGGEAAPRALIERIAQLAPDCVVYNHYGPTEATVGVMVHRVDREHALPDVLPLTTVLANNQIRVLDATLQPVPAGGQGELYLGGAQLCRGYLHNDGLYNDALGSAGMGVFIADPWQPGCRLYRTGDLAWVLPDGGIRLAGRGDHQVKIRGYRVELAEIEAALLRLADVRQAVVVAGESAGIELMAFVIAGTAERDAQAWREQLALLLPEHMLPSRFVVLGEFPRLPNGKIDRRALVAMSSVSDDQPALAGMAPRSPLEAVLCQFMTTLLKRERIAADADFFAAGGHSLLAIRLVARIRKLLHIEIEPGLVFDYPTAQALAASLAAIDDPTRLEELAQQHLAQV